MKIITLYVVKMVNIIIIFLTTITIIIIIIPIFKSHLIVVIMSLSHPAYPKVAWLDPVQSFQEDHAILQCLGNNDDNIKIMNLLVI